MTHEMVLVARDSKNSSDPLYKVFVFSQQHASVLCELLKIKQCPGNGRVSVAGYLMWWPVPHTEGVGKPKATGQGMLCTGPMSNTGKKKGARPAKIT